MSRQNIRPLFFVLIVLGLLAGSGFRWRQITRPDYRLRQGQKCAREGDFVEAEQYIALLEQANADDHVHLLKGEVAFAKNNYSAALVQFNMIKDQGDIRLQAAMMTARCFIALREPRAAENALKFVLLANPDHVDACRYLAIIYYDQGYYNLAIPYLERVADLDPKDGKPMRLLGQIYRELDQADEAIKAYEESLRRNPNPDDIDAIRVALAESQFKQFRFDDALATVGNIDNPAAVMVRAESLINLGSVDQATDMLDKALVKWPDNTGLLRLRGRRYQEVKDHANAARLLEKVVAQYGHDLTARTYLALAYEGLNRSTDAQAQNDKVKASQKLIEEAHELLKVAIKDPWDAEVREKLADLHEKLEKPEAAKMWRNAAAACRK